MVERPVVWRYHLLDYVWTPLRQHPVHWRSGYFACKHWWFAHDRHIVFQTICTSLDRTAVLDAKVIWYSSRLLDLSSAKCLHQTVCKRLSYRGRSVVLMRAAKHCEWLRLISWLESLFALTNSIRKVNKKYIHGICLVNIFTDMLVENILYNI